LHWNPVTTPVPRKVKVALRDVIRQRINFVFGRALLGGRALLAQPVTVAECGIEMLPASRETYDAVPVSVSQTVGTERIV
jgi:hypothetical protein